MRKPIQISKISTTLIILILTLSAILITVPLISGQALPTKKTYAMCGVIPNPVGVNQQVLLHVGITDYLQITSDGWEGLTVTVTKPDGTTETLGPFRTDSTGSTGATYTPTQVGTYTFQTHFPETTYTFVIPPIFQPDLVGTTIVYEASDSEIVELTVTDDPIQYYPGAQLPMEYWTRPIDAQHWEWSTISGSWVTTPPNRYAPNNENAPNTPHVLWAKPLTTGGLVGGEFGPHGFNCGDAYEGKFETVQDDSSVIIAGKLFYNQYETRGDFSLEKEVVAVDMRTGEELWSRNLGNNESLNFGQIFYWDSYNMHSTFEYLWTSDGTIDIYVFGMKVAEGVFPQVGSTWKAFDPFTGRWVYTMENVPSGPMIRGPNGEIFVYTINVENGWMTMWNSSRVVSDHGSWRPQGRTYDARNGIEWNVTLPSGLPSWEDTPISDFIVLEDRIIGSTAITLQTILGNPPITLWGVSTAPGTEGELLFNTEWQRPIGNLNLWHDAASLEDGVFTLWSKEERAHYGFSIDTGAYLWGPTESQVQLDVFGIENKIANGKLFSVGMGGVVYAYDVATGNQLWSYVADDSFSEILWSNNWPLHIAFITDGKIYLTHSEHSVIDPKPRGAPFFCLDVETGEEVFRVDGAFRGTDWGGRAIIGDSIIATYDSYDQQIYAIGKGPSEITVEAPLVSVPQGSSVLFRGTVTDISAGTEDHAIAKRFPKGVPAVADEFMGEWMKYVYKQFPQPMATGVEVKLQVIIDPNGNWYDIGTTTTDATGFYKIGWIPPVPGEYLILASFAGSEAYYGSYIETAIIVDEAPTPATPIEPEEPTTPEEPETPTEPEEPETPTEPEEPETPTEPEEPTEPEQPAEAPLITTEVAIILAVAVASTIGIGAFWYLRKK